MTYLLPTRLIVRNLIFIYKNTLNNIQVCNMELKMYVIVHKKVKLKRLQQIIVKNIYFQKRYLLNSF